MDKFGGGVDKSVMCTRARPCRYWRACKRCEALRQCRIADDVERLRLEFGRLVWVIIYAPDIEAGLMLVSEARKVCGWRAGVWTLERSEGGGVHVNVVTHGDECVGAWWGGVRVWSRVIDGNVREVGAYIAKAAQAIPADSMRGAHSSGKWGMRGLDWDVKAGKVWRGISASGARRIGDIIQGEKWDCAPVVGLAVFALNEGIDAGEVYSGIGETVEEFEEIGEWRRMPEWVGGWKSCPVWHVERRSKGEIVKYRQGEGGEVARRWLRVLREHCKNKTGD